MAEVGLSADAFPLLTRKDSIQFVETNLDFRYRPPSSIKNACAARGPISQGIGASERCTHDKNSRSGRSNYSLNTQLTSAPTHTQHR